MKRLIAMILVAVMLVGTLSGCGSPKPPAEEPPAEKTDSSSDVESPTDTPEEKASADEKLKIGVIYYSLTDQLGSEVVNQLNAFGDWFDVEFQFVQAYTTEDVIAAVENLCSAGCKGILSGTINTSLTQILEICARYDCYLTSINRIIPDDVRESVEGNPNMKYWLGGCSEDEYNAGYTLIQASHKNFGCEKFAILARTRGTSSAHDARYDGMKAAISDLNLKLVGETLWSNGTEAMEAAQSFLSSGKDFDCISVSGSGMDSTLQPIQSSGLDVKLATIDIGANAEEELKKGFISCLLGGQAVDAVFSATIMYNALNGYFPADGELNVVINYLTIDSVETYQKYMDLCVESTPLNKEEISKYMPSENPDCEKTWEADLTAFAAAYSLEDVEARHK